MLRRGGIVQSMSAADNCYDNSFMESCFGTVKTELQLVDYADDAAAVRELIEYFHYYDLERRHSSLGYDTPAEFERRHTNPTV
jgi:putative transposase